MVVSYYEWLQNKQGEVWKETEVNKKLDKTLTKATLDMIAHSKEKDVSYKQAAFEIAISRLSTDI